MKLHKKKFSLQKIELQIGSNDIEEVVKYHLANNINHDLLIKELKEIPNTEDLINRVYYNKLISLFHYRQNFIKELLLENKSLSEINSSLKNYFLSEISELEYNEI